MLKTVFFQAIKPRPILEREIKFILIPNLKNDNVEAVSLEWLEGLCQLIQIRPVHSVNTAATLVIGCLIMRLHTETVLTGRLAL